MILIDSCALVLSLPPLGGHELVLLVVGVSPPGLLSINSTWKLKIFPFCSPLAFSFFVKQLAFPIGVSIGIACAGAILGEGLVL